MIWGLRVDNWFVDAGTTSCTRCSPGSYTSWTGVWVFPVWVQIQSDTGTYMGMHCTRVSIGSTFDMLIIRSLLIVSEPWFLAPLNCARRELIMNVLVTGSSSCVACSVGTFSKSNGAKNHKRYSNAVACDISKIVNADKASPSARIGKNDEKTLKCRRVVEGPGKAVLVAQRSLVSPELEVLTICS